MAKKVGQIRYYGGTSGNTAGTGKRNYPEGLTRNSLRYGNVFNSIYPIVQLGIQTLPGVKIYINNYTDPIIIGATGIYELDVDGISNITDLQFDNTSLDMIDNNANAYIIIDYIYETE